jgi:formylglycine-generating enzyme required for sulfatase activity
MPPVGSGKQRYLAGGNGLLDVGGQGLPDASRGGFEPGWLSSYDANVGLDHDTLSCFAATWTPSPGPYETRPMNCVNWWEAYAFCIWDGGFLPSEAEWEYAAAGGSEQRQYPWGSADPGTQNQYAIFDCNWGPYDGGYCPYVKNIAPVGAAPLGFGRWGQMDLVGSMFQWTLDEPADFDYIDPFITPCVDCAYVTPSWHGVPGGVQRFVNGGNFATGTPPLNAWLRVKQDVDTNQGNVGFRCARPPEK